ncbi:hypothetical protein [Shuttleworthella satelles]|nr:hypothetical protein [Shuttleworthia satelles]
MKKVILCPLPAVCHYILIDLCLRENPIIFMQAPSGAGQVVIPAIQAEKANKVRLRAKISAPGQKNPAGRPFSIGSLLREKQLVFLKTIDGTVGGAGLVPGIKVLSNRWGAMS